MSDRLRDLGLALLGLALLNSAARVRSEQSLRHHLRDQIRGGQVRVRVASSGLYGMLVGKAALARVTGSGCTLDDVPLEARPGGGMRAEVRAVQIDLRDLVFRGLPLRRMTVDVPYVSMDLGHVIFHDRIVVRRAGVGRASFRVGAAAIEDFARKRYPALRGVSVELQDGSATLSAKLPVLGVERAVVIRGGLGIVDGRQVVLRDPDIRLDGKPMQPGLRSALLTALGPLLDVERDLHLGEMLELDTVKVLHDEVLIEGRATVPVAPPPS